MTIGAAPCFGSVTSFAGYLGRFSRWAERNQRIGGPICEPVNAWGLGFREVLTEAKKEKNG
jgi:hypothetical protein